MSARKRDRSRAGRNVGVAPSGRLPAMGGVILTRSNTTTDNLRGCERSAADW